MTDIKDRIKEALDAKGWSASELAKRSNINKGTISHYLHGDIIPKQSKIGAMATALGVSPAWLMGYDVNMKGEMLQPKVELYKLNANNQARLLAYYQALLDSQEADDGNPQME